jgi:hypothetical protein
MLVVAGLSPNLWRRANKSPFVEIQLNAVFAPSPLIKPGLLRLRRATPGRRISVNCDITLADFRKLPTKATHVPLHGSAIRFAIEWH